MSPEDALSWADDILYRYTGDRLSDLQQTIVKLAWQGHTYPEIADRYGCTEGHVKDTGSELWQILSQALNDKVTKSNLKAVVRRSVRTVVPNLSGLSPGAHHPGRADPSNTPLAPQPSPPISPNFVGRSQAITDLDRLFASGTKVVVIQGEGGLGKTTLAQQYWQQQQVELVLELMVAKETDNLTAAEHVVEEWLQQDLQIDPGRDFGISLGRLKRQLRQRKIGISIDNLEPALDSCGQFVPNHSRYVELLRVLSDPALRSITLITSRDRLCEPSITVQHYRLPGLTVDAWQTFFDLRDIAIAASDRQPLQAMHAAYGGNAKAMGILCGTICEEYDRDLRAYWQLNHRNPLAETSLKNLISSQFDRLEALDPQAYQLLCRLGCFRYQDVATISTSVIASVLWDIPKPDHRRAIESLRNRSLIETDIGQYGLHPAIRAEAIRRLRESDDWHETNRRAADYWTSSVDRIEAVPHALQALEAYYHCVAIHDYEQAGRVILHCRDNQWQQYLTLGSSLYRLGLVQPVLSAIATVMRHTPTTPQLCELYNILGDVYWTTGRVREAIECQQQSLQVVTAALEPPSHPSHQGDDLQQFQQHLTAHQRHYLEMLELDSQLSIGLYRIDLWELESAAESFLTTIAEAQNTKHERWVEKANVGLAVVYAHLQRDSEAKRLADRLYAAIADDPQAHSGRFAFFLQLLGSAYKTLGAQKRAAELFMSSIEYAEESHYIQVKAKAINGLAELARQQAAYESALGHHKQAIALLDGIAAQCDLAEAYLQQALTHQTIDNGPKAEQSLEQARHLFGSFDAEHQLRRVDRLWQANSN